MDLQQIAKDFNKSGFVSGVDILTMEEAEHHRSLLEQAEDRLVLQLRFVSFSMAGGGLGLMIASPS